MERAVAHSDCSLPKMELKYHGIIGAAISRTLLDGRSLRHLHKQGQQVRLVGLDFPVTVSWYYLKRDNGRLEKRIVISTRPLKASTKEDARLAPRTSGGESADGRLRDGLRPQSTGLGYTVLVKVLCLEFIAGSFFLSLLTLLLTGLIYRLSRRYHLTGDALIYIFSDSLL